MTTTLKPNLPPRYGYVDSVFAAINNDVEAWVFVHGVWREWPVADVRFKAKALSKDEFVSMFPKLPTLPKKAFQS
jgi:hypothetical protein